MGIHGLLHEIGPAPRSSLVQLSTAHYVTHGRPLRLAVDISIWLFQIQSGKGGSNPALRTFYYRLLRLLNFNIHPLFVFDGPNKPLFKRNKRVGGPGVRVASVPEFLAKQLLKQFGLPFHVAPGEAEAECALLQREAIVDAVLSEDVDTLMFGCGTTWRNWSAQDGVGGKVPTHANVYRAAETKARSGLDREGMILVALMSGGDYLPEGIPGCGPKVACDAARAGFGSDLCALDKTDTAALNNWRDKLANEIRTNSSRYFSRKLPSFNMPEDFPNLEVLGYYTHPCVSTMDKLARLRSSLEWDQPIDFAALRTFTAEAFDWRCRGGAQKFIRNLAPAMLMRTLRLQAEVTSQPSSPGAQGDRENALVTAIHGKRNHASTDGETEYRISFTPIKLVPIDLSTEEDDVVEGDLMGQGDDPESEMEAEDCVTAPGNALANVGRDLDADASPTKKKTRTTKPYNAAEPEKLWVLRTFLQIGCPLLVEIYEGSLRDPKAFLAARRKARAAVKGGQECNRPVTAKSKPRIRPTNHTNAGMPENALMQYTKVTKVGVQEARPSRAALEDLGLNAHEKPTRSTAVSRGVEGELLAKASTFKLPSAQIMPTQRANDLLADAASSTSQKQAQQHGDEVPRQRTFAAFVRVTSELPGKSRPDATKPQQSTTRLADLQSTPPRRKRLSPCLASPALSQRMIDVYFSPSPRKQRGECEIISLLSSPESCSRLPTPTQPNDRFQPVRPSEADLYWPVPSRRDEGYFPDFSPGKLPDTVTKRRKKGPLRRYRTAPVAGDVGESELDQDDLVHAASTSQESEIILAADILEEKAASSTVRAMDLICPSPAKSESSLPSPASFLGATRKLKGSGSEVAAESLFRQTDVERRAVNTNAVLTAVAPAGSSKVFATRKKTRIQLRESLAGAWKEVDVEEIDLRREPSQVVKGWRKSEVEVLDLTGV